jgi:hypothetical protein
MERMHTFIDVDENRLELWLKPDRIQLVVIDSRPELEAGELRRFASAVFTEYVASGLAAQLSAARLGLREARDLAPGRGDALAAALDGALRALDDAAAAIAVPVPAAIEVPDQEHEVELGSLAASAMSAPAPAPAVPVRELTGLRPYQPLRPSRRGKRACESSTLRWSVGALDAPGAR